MKVPGTISKAYSDVLLNGINEADELPAAIKADTKWGMLFVFSGLGVAGQVDEIEREMKVVLDRLGIVPGSLFSKIYSIDELIFGIKYYLIAWSTMKDLMASLINVSLDLGIHENDVSFGMLLRNKKIQKTNIPPICKKYAGILDVSHTDKRRNSVIHRGKLIDQEVSEYQSKYRGLYSRRYSLLNSNPISDDEFDREIKELNTGLGGLVELKNSEFDKHFKLTLRLNVELAEEIAKLALMYLNQERI